MGYLIVLGLVIVLVPLAIALGPATLRRPGRRQSELSPIRKHPADEGARTPRVREGELSGRRHAQNSAAHSHDDEARAR